ncbi:TAT-variant-translocated molybdopterin oxidoreductase [Spirosoma utsteinense]|uniref:Molybdopterin-containing oxidoreductase family iron-sulfur binding subunit n=1 Tax=Spirosoma utsteinense TaxID=2585773 RepID=A0ABR6W4I6_9BACT|nr:TAT-variant-translocated molybdopterin oxidoreductase [Spirosoma utsteinense]MBC3785458.1 molybdopterin-containing oxidoreductase family iron-sulfur binding subunit [Spirosoma utsteinense]MBC3791513.1 molybdopterin-containing oxidoreductase family iron-sulfur binding subunit [Spirosoma utsteinense]
MENTTKRYWKGVEELRNDATFVKNANSEFANPDPSESPSDLDGLLGGSNTKRRDFMKVMGFGMAAVSLAACETPVHKAIPYLNKPEATFPSISDYYASTYTDGGDYAAILVETREGRPIKIEGNPLSSISKGGTTARVQASLLSLYDIDKLNGPRRGETVIDWATADREITSQLASVTARGGAIRIVTSTILSPATKAVVADFIAKYPSARHIMYDANSAFGMVQANQTSFGQAVIPTYDFSKAQTIVSLGADFLGTWVSPLEYALPYAQGRKIGAVGSGKKTMSRHYQFETGLSMTGANADYRGTYKPSQEGLVALALYNKVAAKVGSASAGGASVDIQYLDKAATDLAATRGRSLVVSGSNDPNVQVIVNALNNLLGNYGTTIDLGKPVNYRQGNDQQMNAFIDEAKAGRVGAVLFFGANPVYDHPRGAELAEALPKISLSISFADRADETASLAKYITPAPHFLECWNDAEPKQGSYSLTQPAITHIFKTRQFQSSLLTWAGKPNDFQTYLKSFWRTTYYPQATGFDSFDAFWIKCLHDGVFETSTAQTAAAGASFAGNVAQAAAAVTQRYKPTTGMELALYEKVSMGTGSTANNPWLQEMPDPVTKACWDNYAALSQKTANDMGLAQNDLVTITVGGKSMELPVLVQPGQADNTVSVAVGYGREKGGKSANGVGKNAFPFVSTVNGHLSYSAVNAKVEKASGTREIAQTQTHDTVMGRRAVVQEAKLADYQKNPMAGRYVPKVETSEGPTETADISLWHGYGKPNHSWGMVIDLNSCIGCNACVVGCQSENNIQVVGRQEVINRREMHWIRIDRYYSSDAEAEDFKALEVASANPEVVFQPMLCQHCSNAPCETVCPVLATTHSTEGLNQMTYNRCIGTRYCANNCPYKVRRFNWWKYFDNDNFDYHFNNDLGKMVINPDVTVRSRGVIEKCSFCVQRIQEGKLTAKKERRRPLPDEIQTACAQACPTNAIIFGDMNNPESTISKTLEVEMKGRAFHVLEEINVRPQISYLTKIRNKDEMPKQETRQESQA